MPNRNREWTYSDYARYSPGQPFLRQVNAKCVNFSKRLRELREAAGYRSQQAFGDAFGVAQSTVGNWEAGAREPNYETTMRLADFFGVTVDDIMGRGDEKKPTLVSESGQGSVNAAELGLIEQYRCLNAEGQEKADDYLDDLLQSGRYKKRDSAGLGREA